mgnify:CR=1 FL=1
MLYNTSKKLKIETSNTRVLKNYFLYHVILFFERVLFSEKKIKSMDVDKLAKINLTKELEKQVKLMDEKIELLEDMIKLKNERIEFFERTIKLKNEIIKSKDKILEERGKKIITLKRLIRSNIRFFREEYRDVNIEP